MNDYARLKVGDEVLIETGSKYQGDEPGRVTKVGRSLYHVLPDRYADRPELHTETFRIATRHSSNDGSLRRLATPAEIALRRQHAEAINKLRDVGLTFRSGYGNDWSTSSLLALASHAEALASSEAAQSSTA